MKNIFSILLILLTACIASAQSAESWYKVYTGKVGNLPATLHLHKAGKDYSGYIWFDQNQWPMQVYPGEPVKGTDSLGISAISGPIALNLTGVFTPNSFSGNSTLSKDNNAGKKAPFQLQLNAEKTFTPFAYYFAEGSAKLAPQYKNESQCRYFSTAAWPVGSGILNEALKKQIQQTLGIKTPAAGIAKWIIDDKERTLNAWKRENGKLSPKEASEMGLSLSVEQENKILVMYENDQHLTLANYNFAYTGGAHGNFVTTLATFNKQSGRKLTLNDVITPAGNKALPLILDRVARLQYSVKNNKPLDQNYFLVNTIKPSENFYVTTTGIGFLYAPYEIKSFADGEVNLLVPFTALKPYLQPAFGVK